MELLHSKLISSIITRMPLGAGDSKVCFEDRSRECKGGMRSYILYRWVSKTIYQRIMRPSGLYHARSATT